MGLTNFLSISEMNIEFKTEYQYYYDSFGYDIISQ